MAQTNGRDRQGPEDVAEALLSILACPACLRPVAREGTELHCTQCGRRYPIRKGIPVMLIDEAQPPEQDLPHSG